MHYLIQSIAESTAQNFFPFPRKFCATRSCGLLPLLRSYAASVTANSRSRVGGSFINIMFGLSLLIFVLLRPSRLTINLDALGPPPFSLFLSLSSLRDIRYGHRRRRRDRKQRRRHGGGARAAAALSFHASMKSGINYLRRFIMTARSHCLNTVGYSSCLIHSRPLLRPVIMSLTRKVSVSFRQMF